MIHIGSVGSAGGSTGWGHLMEKTEEDDFRRSGFFWRARKFTWTRTDGEATTTINKLKKQQCQQHQKREQKLQKRQWQQQQQHQQQQQQKQQQQQQQQQQQPKK